MRPFSLGYITARIIYPILLGIILLPTAQLPPTTVSAMAPAAHEPTAVSKPTAAHEPRATTTTSSLSIISTQITDKPTWADLDLHFVYFCLWSPGGVVPAVPMVPPVSKGDLVAVKAVPPWKRVQRMEFHDESSPHEESLSEAGGVQSAPDQSPRHPKVAIIIDDVGYTSPETEEMVKLPITLTWAILPDTPFAVDYSALAREKRVEVMLHLPLEPEDGSVSPGQGVIKGSWDEPRILSQLNHDLSGVPGVVGVNNHMGSLGTQDHHLMDLLMKTLREKKLFFVDSRTTTKTVAEESAAKYGEPFASRRVFIDNYPEVERKKAALRNLIALARKEGSAIGIAHIRNGNAAAITSMLPEFAAAGIEFVPVSQLVRSRPRANVKLRQGNI